MQQPQASRPSSTRHPASARRPASARAPQSSLRPERRLRDLRGVGPSIEANLRDLGVATVAQLATRDGHELYAALCRKTHTRQDPCVLDTFRCAVAQARDPRLPADQCNWWWWSRQRKALSTAV
jgi:hypothetical protein